MSCKAVGGQECPVCLEALDSKCLAMACGHIFHGLCVLSCWADEPVTAWRCPVCRAAVDLGRVSATSELPADARGCAFYQAHATADARCGAQACDPASADPERGCMSDSNDAVLPLSKSAAPLSAGSKAGRRPSSAGGRLAAVERFFSRAEAALQEDDGGGKGGGRAVPTTTAGTAASWVLAAAERVLPEPALAAAASGLAALRLRQLLHSKEQQGGVAAALASWVAALLFLAAGVVLGAALLGRFLGYGLLLLCHINQWAAAHMGMLSTHGACLPPLSEPPNWIVALLWGVSAVVVLEGARHRAPRGGLLPALALRLEACAPRLLLALYSVAFGLAAGILLISLLLNFASLAASWAMMPPSQEPPVLLYLTAWQPQQQPSEPTGLAAFSGHQMMGMALANGGPVPDAWQLQVGAPAFHP